MDRMFFQHLNPLNLKSRFVKKNEVIDNKLISVVCVLGCAKKVDNFFLYTFSQSIVNYIQKNTLSRLQLKTSILRGPTWNLKIFRINYYRKNICLH